VILPTKGILPRQALLTLGAEVLRQLPEEKTVSRLWEDFRKARAAGDEVGFDWFVLSLDLLFALGTVEYESGRVRRVEPREAVEAS
jgi:hypothetical protein